MKGQHNVIPPPPPPMPTTKRRIPTTTVTEGGRSMIITSPPVRRYSSYDNLSSIIPSNRDHRDSIKLYSKTYSFYQSSWKFNNLLPEIISIILSFFSYYSESSHSNTVPTYFVPLEESIQNLRLSCRNWNEGILLDHNSQLQQYYVYNKQRLEQNFIQKFPKNIQLPIFHVHSTGNHVFESLLVMGKYKQRLETYYVSIMKRKAIRNNIRHWFQFTEYPRWMIVATAVYLCLMLFFAMLFVQDVFISIFGSIVTDTFIRYFYNLIFVPLYLVLAIFLLVVSFVTIDFEGCRRETIKFVFFGFGSTCVFCGLVASTVFMIQLNIGILPLYTTPSLFGRAEMIPWPFAFIPWCILLICFAVLFSGFSLFILQDNIRKCRWPNNEIYILSVFLFMFIETLLCLLLVVWISIALEFPSVIASTNVFIPAYIMEFVLFIFTFCNIFMELTSISKTRWAELGWQRTVCLFGLVFGMALNHIICSLSWYHWIPLAVAYIEVMFPLTCFYAWTMMMLYPRRIGWYDNLKAFIKPIRDYSNDLKDGSWSQQISRAFGAK